MATSLSQEVLRQWEDNPDRIFRIPTDKGGYEQARILNVLAVMQPVHGELIIPGIDNNQATVELDLDEVRLPQRKDNPK